MTAHRLLCYRLARTRQVKIEVEDAMDYQAYVERVEAHEVQMRAVMSARGATHEMAALSDAGLGWMSAQTRCIFCRNADKCASWMADRDTAHNPLDFCPNLGFFDQFSEPKPD
ncbi:MAG: hypothetical protein B7Z29_08400 [Hyphomicrobium sp. 12-62-95]|nr:MAG: hypothetical protein B7Z29_08400 [Hyphomicrobium sp. 12-62-95]